MRLDVKTSKKTKGIYVIAPAGSIDSNTYQILEKETQRVLKKNPQKIILDMEGVEYISSMGIRVVLATLKALRKTDGDLIFIKLQPQIKKVFEIVNALPSLKIFKSMAEMDEYLDIMQNKVKTGEA